MLCDLCQKDEATVHYTEVVHNQMIKMDLCEGCAKKKGVGLQTPFSISDLLAGLTDDSVSLDTKDTVLCSKCGMSYLDFKSTGRLGCSNCYETFSKSLIPLIKTIHRGDTHIGKIPTCGDKKVKAEKTGQHLQDLRMRLRQVVENEEFEEAAGIRDEIKKLEKGLPQKE